MSLTEPSLTYKPFNYPWAYDFWKRQQQLHWLPTEVPMGQDIMDMKAMDERKRFFLTNVFRMFVQADVDVHNCYHKIYQRIFKPTEVQMMLSAFSNMETVHIAAYSHLLDTLGYPEAEYGAYGQLAVRFNTLRSFYGCVRTQINDHKPAESCL